MKLVLSLIIILFSFTVQAGKQIPIAEWAGMVKPLTLGKHIPNVILWTGNGDPVHLRKLVHKKPTVLLFYQGAWSPFCSNQLDNLKEIADKLGDIGFQIVAISPDSPHKLLKSRKKKHLNYLLLSDYHLEAARSFGLAYRLSPKEAKIFKKKYGAEFRQVKGEKKYNLPVPGVFMLDTSGKIHFQYVNPDFKSQLSPGLLLEAAKMVASHTKKKPSH